MHNDTNTEMMLYLSRRTQRSTLFYSHSNAPIASLPEECAAAALTFLRLFPAAAVLTAKELALALVGDVPGTFAVAAS
jgi:hypothetical protein